MYETVTTATPTTVTTTKITGPPVYTTTLTSPLPTTITITATTSMASPTTMAPGGTAASTASCAAFTPTNTAPPATYKGDAFYDVSEADLYAGLFCVGGVESVTNPILLVPGTGNVRLLLRVRLYVLRSTYFQDGAQSWQDGYEILYGNLGYDVCWVSPPPCKILAASIKRHQFERLCSHDGRLTDEVMMRFQFRDCTNEFVTALNTLHMLKDTSTVRPESLYPFKAGRRVICMLSFLASGACKTDYM